MRVLCWRRSGAASKRRRLLLRDCAPLLLISCRPLPFHPRDFAALLKISIAFAAPIAPAIITGLTLLHNSTGPPFTAYLRRAFTSLFKFREEDGPSLQVSFRSINFITCFINCHIRKKSSRTSEKRLNPSKGKSKQSAALSESTSNDGSKDAYEEKRVPGVAPSLHVDIRNSLILPSFVL